MIKERTKTLNNSSNQNLFFLILLFFLNPIISLINSLKNYKQKNSKNIVWFFVGFFGLTMNLSDDLSDSSRYIDRFRYFEESNIRLTEFLNKVLFAKIEFIEPLISYITSIFTTNPQFLFLNFALIFGFFYSRNIWSLLKLSDKRPRFKEIFILLIFASIIGFWQINGFRFWTAAQIFFFGVINFFINKKKSGIYIAFSSILFHLALIIPIACLIIYLLLGNKLRLYFFLFIVTFIISELRILNLLDFFSNSSSFIYSEFLNTEFIDNRKNLISTARNWRFKAYPLILKYVNVLFVFIIYNKFKKHKINFVLHSVFCFGILLFSVSNIVSMIPSGSRFFAITYILIIFVFYGLLANNLFLNIKKAYFFTFPFLFFWLIGTLWNASVKFTVYIFTNPFISFILN